MIASIFSGSAVTADPYYEYTTLLLPGNGTNGAQNNTFLDGSTNNFTITRNGNTTQGTFSPFSQTGWGNYFNGSNAYLYAAANTAFQFGTGDFTIEMWLNFSANSGSYKCIFSNRGTDATSVFLGINPSGKLVYYRGGELITDANVLATNTWVHVALVRNGNTITMYKDGTSVGSVTDTTNLTGNNCYIAQESTLSSPYYPGYISNLRIVKGTAVYTGSFTPSTTPLTAISGTSILTCQSNRFRDASSNSFTVTAGGSPTVVAFSPFNPTASWSAATYGGSGYFDGSGDYLTAASNAAFAFGTGVFTIEAWVYLTSTAGANIFQDETTNSYQFYVNTSSKLEFTVSGVAVIATSSASIVANQWNHVAVVREGTGSNQVKLYINGGQDGSGTSATSIVNSATNYIGRTGTGTRQLNGYLSDLRIVKGTAVYTGNFTPPTAPLTATQSAGTNIAAITGTATSLLLNFTNAGIYDATSKNDLETVGNAQISTAQSKWGGSSISFDGTGDWLLIPDQPPQRIGTGNFTIEMWVYRNSSGTYGLAGKGTGTTGWLVSLNSSNQVVFTYGSSTITSSGTVSATTWTHIAVVREGTSTNQTKIYISGTNDGTGTVSTDFNQTNSMYIGADRTGGSAANAYVQDVRITNYARYTGNFTAPTAAFPTL
jgi:hypothetical protein